MTLEICAFSLEDALTAQANGADRIELCADASAGGITPSAGVLQTARELLHIPVFVMIRPRGGSFTYTASELTAMHRDIALCRELRFEGVVLGVLDSANNVDRLTTAALVSAARPMQVTFHRAFDRTPDAAKALEDLIAAGCSRLLTSGHQPTAPEGVAEIASLIQSSRGRIAIMPGSGVRSSNLADLLHQTGAQEVHSSARASDSIDPSEVQKLHHITRHS